MKEPVLVHRRFPMWIKIVSSAEILRGLWLAGSPRDAEMEPLIVPAIMFSATRWPLSSHGHFWGCNEKVKIRKA
jgi:hypothetical protein